MKKKTNTLGTVVKFTRRSKKMSQQSLCGKLKISRPTLNAIETGRGSVSQKTVDRVCEYLGIKVHIEEPLKTVGDEIIDTGKPF